MKAEIYFTDDTEEDNPFLPLSSEYPQLKYWRKMFGKVSKERNQWKAAALRAEKRSRVVLKRNTELNAELNEVKKVVRLTQILGVDTLLIGQEYWVNAHQFDVLSNIADTRMWRCPGLMVGVAGLFHNGRPVIYKPELD